MPRIGTPYASSPLSQVVASQRAAELDRKRIEESQRRREQQLALGLANTLLGAGQFGVETWQQARRFPLEKMRAEAAKTSAEAAKTRAEKYGKFDIDLAARQAVQERGTERALTALDVSEPYLTEAQRANVMQQIEQGKTIEDISQLAAANLLSEIYETQPETVQGLTQELGVEGEQLAPEDIIQIGRERDPQKIARLIQGLAFQASPLEKQDEMVQYLIEQMGLAPAAIEEMRGEFVPGPLPPKPEGWEPTQPIPIPQLMQPGMPDPRAAARYKTAWQQAIEKARLLQAWDRMRAIMGGAAPGKIGAYQEPSEEEAWRLAQELIQANSLPTRQTIP